MTESLDEKYLQKVEFDRELKSLQSRYSDENTPQEVRDKIGLRIDEIQTKLITLNQILK